MIGAGDGRMMTAGRSVAPTEGQCHGFGGLKIKLLSLSFTTSFKPHLPSQ